MALNLRNQTAAQFAERFWLALRDLQHTDKFAFARRVWWLIERINAGDITDAGARSTFNSTFGRSLTAQQWETFKANRLIPIHDRYAAMIAETEL